MIKIEYGAIESGAKDSFNPELMNCSSLSKETDLKQDGLEFKNFSNPCERYSAFLDGSRLPIPENTEAENFGVWSEYASNDVGVFDIAAPVVRLVSDEPFSAEGLTLEFDSKNNVYPTEMTVNWYNGDELVASKECAISAPTYSVFENIAEFDKIDLSFDKMNTPYSRLRLHRIEYGTLLVIDGKNIKSLKINQKANPISSTVPIGNADIVFKNDENTDYNFSSRQSLRVFDNNALIGKFFIENARQTSKKQWNVSAQDYIAILESTDFAGGIYVNEYAENLLTEIFGKANVPFTIAENLKKETVSGYIPYTTCRGALQQVLFAICAYANTAYSDAVNILQANSDVVESIGLSRILTGQSVTVGADVTQVELLAHNYTPAENETVLYQAEAAGENITVIFSSPAHSLTIENGEILERGTNYAVITCQANGVLRGKGYEHSTVSKVRTNEKTLNKKSSNKKTIKTATLVSAQNIDKVLASCYNYLTRTLTVKSRVIEGENTLLVGNSYEVDTKFMGKVSGTLVEQNFSIYGGKKITKEMVIQ